MKKIVFLFSLCCMVVFASTVQAQTVCHIVRDSIVPYMQSYKKAQSEAADFGKILQKQIEGEQAKMQAYYMDIQQKQSAGLLTPLQIKEAEAKLQKMQEDYQKFLAESEQKLIEKEQEFVQPVFDEFNNAIKAVCKENGYAYVIDSAFIMYSDGGIDITEKVRAKLGLK